MASTKRTRSKPIEEQIKSRVAVAENSEKSSYDGNIGTVISTGSTLLDLAISGGRVRGGGIPGGIMVVAYGPSGSGKTALACEVAGAIQRQGGDIKYRDTEARLDERFASVFGIDLDKVDLEQPNTVLEAFSGLRTWEMNTEIVNGYIVDSLAALSTDLEMDNEDGDKMGMRRAKEFSEQLRKSARIVKQTNTILFCTNQIRQNVDAANKYARKDVNPGGKAIEFYSSLILRFASFKRIKKKVTVKGKQIERTVGISGELEVVKSSIWKPYRTAPVTIYFDYGIDDIRENLQFIKDFTKSTVYTLNGEPLSNKMDDAIALIEDNNKEQELKEQVIELWEEIERKFDFKRKAKTR